MSEPFTVGLTCDFLAPDGTLTYRDIGLDLLRSDPAVAFRFMDRHPMLLAPGHLRGCDAVISLGPRWTAESLRGVERLALVARFGVGHDAVDLAACTRADVAVTIAAGAVNFSLAESIVAWMLALSHRVLEKDRLLREGRWGDKDRTMGCELRDRTLGIVGLGGIGGALVAMLRPFGMKPPLACDPFTLPARAVELGVSLVPLERLLREADFVSINCPLNDKTRNLVGRAELALMKPDAFLINTARGGIVDEEALAEALRAGRIRGAAIDVFAVEPAGADHPLAKLGNVLLAPHAIGWTDELFRDIGRMACSAALRVARGEVPEGVVNREVLERPGFVAKLARLRKARS